jgi:hypothetical protein
MALPIHLQGVQAHMSMRGPNQCTQSAVRGLPKSRAGVFSSCHRRSYLRWTSLASIQHPVGQAGGFFLRPSGLTTITRVRALEVHCPEALRRSEERPVSACPAVRSTSRRTQRKEQAVRQVGALLRAHTLPVALQDGAQRQTRSCF